MRKPWRRLALAAALNLGVGVGVVTAQTVVVKNAPAGAGVEVTFNGAPVATAKADASGDATLPIRLQGPGAGATETDVRISVDACGTLRRLVLSDHASLPPAPADGCERRDVPGLFVVKSVTTLLVDAGGPRPAVWLRQGPVPSSWLLKESEVVESTSTFSKRPSPTGLVLFGGGDFAMFRTGVTPECGNVEGCTSGNSGPAVSAGVDFWLTRFLGVEGAYTRPKTLKASGSGSYFKFDSSLESEYFTIAGKPAAPLGPVRIYGIAGVNFHRALFTTTQTADERTTTVNDETITIPGGSETWAAKTTGWGWLFGGGIEIWATPRLAFYGEFTHAKVSGKSADDPAFLMDERTTFFVGGMRIHIGR